MIKARLKQWGYLKNAKREDWYFLALLYQNRKDRGKQSTVFDVRGHRKTVKDLQRFIRNQGVTVDQFLRDAREAAGDKQIPDYIQAVTPDHTHYQDSVPEDEDPDRFTPSPLQSSAHLDMRVTNRNQFLHPTGYNYSRSRSISAASSNEPDFPPYPVMRQQRPSTVDTQDAHYTSTSFSASSSASSCSQLQWEFETCASQITNPAPLMSRIGHEDLNTWALLTHSPSRSDNSGSSVRTEFVCSRCNQPSNQHFISLDSFEPRQAPIMKRDILNGDHQPLHLPISTKEEGSWLWVSRCFLACMCLSKGDTEAAELSLHQAAVEFERLLQRKDRLLLTAAGLVMTILHMHDQGDIARKVIGSANQVAMRLLPPEHPILVTMQYLTASADVSQAKAGITSQTLKTVWHNLSFFYQYEPSHEYIIAARYNYAWMLKFEGHLDQAENEARAVYELSCRVLGKLHMQSITCLAVIAGCMYDKKPRLNECIEIFGLVVRDTESCLGVHHPYTLEAKRRMAEKILERDGPSERTLHLYRDVLWGRARMLGLAHRFTVAAREGYEDELQSLDLWVHRGTGEPTRWQMEVDELFTAKSPGERSWTRIDRRRRNSNRYGYASGSGSRSRNRHHGTRSNRFSGSSGVGGGYDFAAVDDDVDIIDHDNEFDDDDDDLELVMVSSRTTRRSESPRNTAGGYGAY